MSCRGNKHAEEEFARESHSEQSAKVRVQDFQDQIEGVQTNLNTITNGMVWRPFFLIMVSDCFSLRAGLEWELEDIVLGFSSLEKYMNAKEKYFGATIGNEYQLDRNNGENHLHGGTKGFHNVVWQARKLSPNQLLFTGFRPILRKDIRETWRYR